VKEGQVSRRGRRPGKTWSGEEKRRFILGVWGTTGPTVSDEKERRVPTGFPNPAENSRSKKKGKSALLEKGFKNYSLRVAPTTERSLGGGRTINCVERREFRGKKKP